MAIRLERLRVREALDARDVAVSRLAGACAFVREKTDELNCVREEKVRLQTQLELLQARSPQKENIVGAGPTSDGDASARSRKASKVNLVVDQVASLAVEDGSPKYEVHDVRKV